MSTQEIVAPQEGAQTLFMNTDADVVLYGGAAGSGKSHSLIMDALKFKDDPDFYGVYFRQNTVQLAGSLWPLAKKMWKPFGAVFREKEMTATFPSGAKIKFSYMELDKDKDKHQGIEYAGQWWDEFTHFTESQFHYLRSRMRSRAKNKAFLKASMNPDRDHFVYDWVSPFLYECDQIDPETGEVPDEKRKGCPNRDLSGKIRYFVIIGNDFYSSWDREELQEKFPRNRPRTYTFISASIDDNPILDEIEPDYRETLESLPHVNKQRLRYGNWDVRPMGSGYFQREWCEIVPQAPRSAVRVRSWDLASTVPSDVNPDPDWTAGVKMSKDKDGFYYVEDVNRFRDRPAGVEAEIMNTATFDGSDSNVTVPQDPGAAGKSTATQIIRKLAEKGYTCRAKPTNKNKVTRFSPFSAAAEAGLVKIVQGAWNKAYFSELEAFTGDGKTKDDQVDGTADAFITLAEKKHVPPFAPPSMRRVNPFKS